MLISSEQGLVFGKLGRAPLPDEFNSGMLIRPRAIEMAREFPHVHFQVRACTDCPKHESISPGAEPDTF